ncbi:electron transport complex protein RnfB [Thorsellia anophelis DSM 18579]|uniref:Ion-translocating oxidoreductase complex subunit B n=1 Tax=Thorsellia anophelis DSM 18579 TaxID=1123402 RepID=A0A1I0CT80_9GAMM|nr:electron transport complex subunit RsxB [Thorsellia anophelis]SET23000.1 electron transport complex protein RnfB [Thorsellia anophelis DSM 18579]
MNIQLNVLFTFFVENLAIAIIALSFLALVCGAILGYAAKRFFVTGDPIVDKIDALLPQSQCAQCGYPGCKPYAQAVGEQGEAINKCAPGGEQVMLKIAELLGVDPQPIGEGAVAEPVKKVAYIDEDNCIGCVKCIQVCPVDAIVGATRAMHTVITDACTGCDLCVAPCPTNCITMITKEELRALKFKSLAAISIDEIITKPLTDDDTNNQVNNNSQNTNEGCQ